MKQEIEFYKKELERLVKFITETKILIREDIIKWIGECASLLVFLNVPDFIVRGFVQTFDDYFSYKKDEQFSIWVNKNNARNRVKSFLYINLAFEIANINVNKLADQERLIKHILIEILKNDQRCYNIISGLESMENAYKIIDADSLVSHAQAVLESTCNISKKLSSLKDIHQKLTTIKNDPQMKKLFSSQDWLIDCFLNFYKPIRNKMIMHKKTIFPYTSPIPIAVAVGYSFLVIVFIEMALLGNKLFRIKI